MKPFNCVKLVTATLVTSIMLTEAIAAQAPMIQISRNLNPDPIIINGTADKTAPSNCGNISTTPNHVIRVTESLPYLRITAKGAGQPTLLIDGNGGRFCVMADSSNRGQAELSGLWQPGDYSVSVGNLSQRQFSYTIEVSQQK